MKTTHLLPHVDQQTILDKEYLVESNVDVWVTKMRHSLVTELLGAELPNSWPATSHEHLNFEVAMSIKDILRLL
jgi:hypothetical protein